MAGEWIRIDTNIGRKPQVAMLRALTGEALETIVGRLVIFWSWVDEHCAEKTVIGITPQALAVAVGGDENFWVAMEKVGWILFTADGATIPGFESRFSKSAKKRTLDAQRMAQKRVATKSDMCRKKSLSKRRIGDLESESELESDQISLRSAQVREGSSTARATPRLRRADQSDPADQGCLTGEISERAAELAGDLCRRAGYHGRDAKIFWIAALLVDRRELAEAAATSAAEGCRVCRPKNVAGYFRQVLRDECAKRGRDFDALAKRVKFPRRFCCAAPREPPPPAAANGVLTKSAAAAGADEAARLTQLRAQIAAQR